MAATQIVDLAKSEFSIGGELERGVDDAVREVPARGSGIEGELRLRPDARQRHHSQTAKAEPPQSSFGQLDSPLASCGWAIVAGRYYSLRTFVSAALWKTTPNVLQSVQRLPVDRFIVDPRGYVRLKVSETPVAKKSFITVGRPSDYFEFCH